jgi:hypothetical protein
VHSRYERRLADAPIGGWRVGVSRDIRNRPVTVMSSDRWRPSDQSLLAAFAAGKAIVDESAARAAVTEVTTE